MDKVSNTQELKNKLEETDIFDVVTLIKLANRAQKSNAYDNESLKHLKIAVLGTNSIQYMCKIIKLFLFFRYDIVADIFEGEYDGIAGSILDETSELYSFAPDITILIPDVSDLKILPKLLSDDAEISEALQKAVDYYKSLWDKLANLKTYVFQANLVAPPLSQLGNLEANYAFSKGTFIRMINIELIRQKTANVTFLDYDSLASELGKNKWFDYTSYFLSKQGFCIEFLGKVCDLACRQIAALSGKTKKCLVLDLDNTLWGGVVGDDSFDGIQLDPNNAVGESFRFFQKYICELKSRGVILAVCSKNDEAVAKEPFLKNKNIILKLDDISCFVANWTDKATNIRHIAKELNIGTDSLVFFDDNPAEREIVKLNLPEVLVVDVPADSAYFASALHNAHAFDWLQITKEDISRAFSYTSNNARTEMEGSFVNYDEYLKALDMTAELGFLDTKRISRFTQLINKSNQFNLRTKRYSEADISELSNNSNYRLIYAELTDKFSDYGLVSCVILNKNGNTCFIDTWVMSCRVLKRGLENLLFDFVVKIAKELGCNKIIGEYIPTPKNAMVKDFYSSLGFEKSANNDVCELENLEIDKTKIFINMKEGNQYGNNQ